MVYVDSPVNCKIYLKYKTQDSSYEMKELLLTQVFNYKISENKRPVYGFNKLDYSQVVRGKRLFEGIIVIKKSLLSDISRIVGVGNPTMKDNLNYAKIKVEYLKRTIENDKSIQSKCEDYLNRAMEEYELKVRQYISQKNADILNELPNDTSIILAFGSYMNVDDFKTKYETMVNNYNPTAEDLESLISNNSEFVIEDVNFFEKTGELNISKNDIDEVYKFFGKLKTWSDV